MIIQEYNETLKLYHTYSDAGVYIHGGSPEGDYTEAYDPVQRTYTETETPIDDMTETEEKAAAYDIITGGTDK